MNDLVDVYVYPDGEVYDTPPEWKSDDYEVRESGYCEECDSSIIPIYAMNKATCDCQVYEWNH